ncbi:hypothetical protein ACOMHN_012085 [Nucella lapillus]
MATHSKVIPTVIGQHYHGNTQLGHHHGNDQQHRHGNTHSNVLTVMTISITMATHASKDITMATISIPMATHSTKPSPQ